VCENELQKCLFKNLINEEASGPVTTTHGVKPAWAKAWAKGTR